MASLGRPEISHNFQFGFDPATKILLVRVEGRFTDESGRELYKAIRKYSVATNAPAGILDLSSVIEFALSDEFIHRWARGEPAMPDAMRRSRIIVVPDTFGYGLARIFGLLSEPTNPLLQIVHTIDKAFSALGVQSPHFEPLE